MALLAAHWIRVLTASRQCTERAPQLYPIVLAVLSEFAEFYGQTAN